MAEGSHPATPSCLHGEHCAGTGAMRVLSRRGSGRSCSLGDPSVTNDNRGRPGTEGEDEFLSLAQGTGPGIGTIRLAKRIRCAIRQLHGAPSASGVYRQPRRTPSYRGFSRRVSILPYRARGRIRRTLCVGLRSCLNASIRYVSGLQPALNAPVWSPWRCHGLQCIGPLAL